MARARNIKPGFYKNEDLAECSIWARFIFPGLWTLADRDGRLEDRPKRIKAELLPFDSQDVEPLLVELHNRCFILRYRNEAGNFIQILKFAAHQSPHYSEKKSVIKPPEFPESYGDEQATTPRKPPDDSGNSGGIKRGSQPPESLVLNPDSLNPDKSIVGLLPDVDPLAGKNGKTNPGIEAREVLEFLNEKAGRRYQANRVNLGFILARLKDGATVTECRQVIAKKCREWGADEKMAEYLRPATLFNATKFAQYQGELVVVPRETSAPEANRRAADAFVEQGALSAASKPTHGHDLPDDFIAHLISAWGKKLGVTQGADESDEEYRSAVRDAVRVESETGNPEAVQAMNMIGAPA